MDVEYQLSVGQEVNTYGYGWGIDAWNGLADTGRITDQLNEALDATETGVDVDDGSKFANGDYILVDQEIMKVTGVSSNTLTVTRDLTTNEGTTTVSAGSHNATTHADNATVTLIFDASGNKTLSPSASLPCAEQLRSSTPAMGALGSITKLNAVGGVFKIVIGDAVYVEEEVPSEATTSKTTLSSLSKLPIPSKMSFITDDVFEMVLVFPEVSVTVQFQV